MDSKNHDQSYYIGTREDDINNRLHGIDVPGEISRASKSISDRKFGEASEWRTFIFYSLVVHVLHGILPLQYLKHFFLFVYGIYNLLGGSINNDAINYAEICLTKFVIQTEVLYGLKSCTFNVHQLVHLADSVRNCGPLWASAAFIFESNNHVLQKMFHGTQHIPQQIVEFCMISKKIPQLAKKCFTEKTSQPVYSLFEKLRDVKHLSNDACLANGVRDVGKERSVQLTASEVLAVQALLGIPVSNNRGIMFLRFVASSKIFSSVDYTRSKRHVNHYVTFEHEQYKYGVIVGLLVIKPECSCTIAELQYCNCSSNDVVLIRPMVVTSRPLYRDVDFNVNSSFLVEVERAGIQVAIYPHQIRRKCISVTVDQKQYFCPLPYHINDN